MQHNNFLKKVPYEKNRGKACALACYTMVARYFFPKMTFEQIAKISNWKKGYVIWGFKFWLWIMNKGVKIINYDSIDYNSWANNGIEGLRKAISQQEYDFLVKHTYDINSYSKEIKAVLNHPNFTFVRKKPNWNNLVSAFKKGFICEVVLDSVALDKKEKSFSLHRVVVLDITDKHIIFHDPRTNKQLSERKESIKLFKNSWLEKLQGPELCIYKK